MPRFYPRARAFVGPIDPLLPPTPCNKSLLDDYAQSSLINGGYSYGYPYSYPYTSSYGYLGPYTGPYGYLGPYAAPYTSPYFFSSPFYPY